MSKAHIETYVDPDFGAIAVARDECGNVVATASSGIDERGTYVAVDEAGFYQATGQLLPMQVWEAAILDEDGEGR